MEKRDFEKLVTIEPGKRAYCTVCQKFATEGEFYRHVDNRHIGRHVTCIPKAYLRPPKKEDDSKKLAISKKRRRAGGHGYSGGDGWIDVK